MWRAPRRSMWRTPRRSIIVADDDFVMCCGTDDASIDGARFDDTIIDDDDAIARFHMPMIQA